MPDGDAGLAPGVPARALLGRGPAAVLLTRGADGVVVLDGAGETEVPAPPVDVADTIGAGDAFGGAFAAWYAAQGLDRRRLGDHDALAEATAFSCLVAAKTCERPGATPPLRSELPEPLTAT